MIDDIKKTLAEYKTFRDVDAPYPKLIGWLAALVEFYEAAENQGFDVWHRELTNYKRFNAARKKLEGGK